MSEPSENPHITVSGITLVDASGRLRASLTLSPDSELPCLRMYDAKQCERSVIGVGKNGQAFISLLRADGKVAIGMEASSTRSVGIAIFDYDGNPAFSIEVDDDDERSFEIHDREGNCVWHAP